MLMKPLAAIPRLDYAARCFVVEWVVPFNRKVGMKVGRVTTDPHLVELRLPSRRSNTNIAGTVHGAAIFALAETAHGVALLWHFSPSVHRMFTKKASIEFLAPANGDLVVSYRCLDADLRRIEADLQADARSEVSLVSCVADSGGIVVARLNATYVIRRKSRRTSAHPEAGEVP